MYNIKEKEVNEMDEEKKKTPKTIRGKYTPAQNEYTKKNLRENYFSVRLKKDDKPEIQAAAEKVGMSMRGYIIDCIYRRNYEVLHGNEKEDKDKPE